MASNLSDTIGDYLLQQFKDDFDDTDYDIYKTYDPSDPEIDKSLTDPDIYNKILGV